MTSPAPLYCVQLAIDLIAAIRALPSLSHSARHDADLVLKTVLTEAFGGAAVRPWSRHAQHGPTVTVLGYTVLSQETLQARLALAFPGLQQAVSGLSARPLPDLAVGDRFRFSVRLCPTVHITKGEGRRYGERDAFLVAVDRGAVSPTRDEVYADYVRERLAGARVEACRLAQMRLAPMLRPHRGANAPRSGLATKTTPDIVIEGGLDVTDPGAFIDTLAHGIGRQRGYGRGFVRLEPLRLALAA